MLMCQPNDVEFAQKYLNNCIERFNAMKKDLSRVPSEEISDILKEIAETKEVIEDMEGRIKREK